MARTLYPIPLLIATLLAAHGLNKGSLSFSGAIAAFLVGYFHLACPLKLFGVSLIAFYLIGSRATKVKVKEKAKVEHGVEVGGKGGGNRDAIQVLSNSLPTLLAALVYRFQYSYTIDPTSACVTDTQARPLIFLALGHFSTCLADTLASELGILSPSRPFHVLTFQSVPKGTNGGVSYLGLSVSVLGGLIMGLVGVIDLYIENTGCGADGGSSWAVEMILFSMVAGLAGSLLDSLLGATMQHTLYSMVDKKIYTDKSIISPRDREVKQIVNIGYGRDILSNSGVNLVSTGIMAGIGFWYGGGRYGVLGF